MARLREARVRFHVERREAEKALRAACEAAGVEWTMGPLPTPAEEASVAAAQRTEMQERESRLQALVTVASAPTTRGGVQPDDIDYDEDDDEDDDEKGEDDAVLPVSSTAAGNEIDYDEEDDEGDTEDDADEAEMSVGPSAVSASATAAGNEIDYDEEDDEGGTEDDEVSCESTPLLP